ncbi:hypothetical protein NP493_742g00006 [Ridgeia piscesae]|uniref:Uncharacterized protein n=1 Tax=Ridgeia piscesae TaxID=27915 RepID=A0AAD9KQ42_RIDPI|nr:hypothetical protein NP493_742g00006 [Ridgeia piscesae]
MPASRAAGSSTWRALVDAPGMFLVHKYNQFKRQRQTDSRRKVTENELQRLNGKIKNKQVFCGYEARWASSMYGTSRRRLPWDFASFTPRPHCVALLHRQARRFQRSCP